MLKLRSALLAAAILVLSAGIAVAKNTPVEHDRGLELGGSFLTDSHGAAVSEIASEETPEGDWSNHGEYVSSIATGWGEEVSAQATEGAGDASAAADGHAADGLAHRP